jgi:hypothetical protein
MLKEGIMEKEEYLQIKEVCENYGYATVMLLASALWRHDFNKNDFSTDAVLYPTQMSRIDDKYKLAAFMVSTRYDEIVDGFENYR